jgi:hypothetical protein
LIINKLQEIDMSEGSPTLLCVASYFKGERFLVQAKKEGARVFLLTEDKWASENWPRESIDELFLMPDLSKIQDIINAVSYLYRSNYIDQIIALDEYDVENVATLREHLRLPGMGQSQTRFFRDKLSMRMRAAEHGLPVPPFTGIFNYDSIRDYMNRVSPPWVMKPRTQASSMGIKKINNSEEVWRAFDQAGDEQSNFLLEQYVPGEVFHVDSVIYRGKILFTSFQQYGRPPMNVYHEGGVFTTKTLSPASPEALALKDLNARVIEGLGMEGGVTHAEYIKGKADGQFYFLEIATRVGGAHIADMVEFATGVNLWAEWARVEIARIKGEDYKLPSIFQKYGGLLVSLAKQEHPDSSAYNDPEIVWRMDKKNHVGLIVVSESGERVQQLLDNYVQRVAEDFLAVAPPKEKATH